MTGRNAQRKAETRQKIVRAAHDLFVAQGYEATSMEQIARTAGVAIRTIYLRYDSKAALLLAYHDAWLDALVRLLGTRRPDEELDAVMRRVLDALVVEGLGNDRSIEEITVLPPFLEFVDAGSPEIAGHLLQRWVVAQDELTRRFREIAGEPPDSLRPRLEASAVFAAWMTSILDVRERWRAGVPGASAHQVALAAIRASMDGLAADGR